MKDREVHHEENIANLRMIVLESTAVGLLCFEGVEGRRLWEDDLFVLHAPVQRADGYKRSACDLVYLRYFSM